jgi:primosomal protein N' (replication factor Y)
MAWLASSKSITSPASTWRPHLRIETGVAHEYAEVLPIPAVPDLAPLTYRIPDALRATDLIGARVLVPLGRRRVTGIVTDFADHPPPDVRCKELLEILDGQPLLTPELLRLAQWMADYYVTTPAEVLSLVVPKGLTQESRRVAVATGTGTPRGVVEQTLLARLLEEGGRCEVAILRAAMAARKAETALKRLVRRGAVAIEDSLFEARLRPHTQRFVELIAQPDGDVAEALFRRAQKRRQVYEYLLGCPQRRAPVAELGEVFSSCQAQISELERAGVVRRIDLEVYRGVSIEAETGHAPEMTDAQRVALDTVRGEIGNFAAVLLHGVTSSGKTEVYLRAIEEVLGRGDSALVLVPEISLTHQTVARLVGRFGPTVAVLHSELTGTERWEEWRRIRRGHARIAVGARSAVLAPLERLGLIVVDEEHDAAYKQDDGVRYHGRDVAIMRARLAQCPVVLGSATPSIESWYNADRGRYRHVELPERVTFSPLPTVEVVDLRGRDIAATGGLSERLRELLHENHADGGQALVFLNRRGYAGHVQCYECGEIEECTRCSVGMTFHRDERRVRCHHCDASRPVPTRCSACGKDALSMHGLGTQRLEDTLRSLLPDARIERLDRDTSRKRGHVRDVMSEWRAGAVDVLIGTQMIAKGHDASGVTLVGVVHADLGLAIPDFRAVERTFQTLTQVAGRAGRGDRRGRVVLQTYRPDHIAVAAAAAHDYAAFVQEEIAARRELAYPPFSRMVLVRVEGMQSVETTELAAAIGRALHDLSNRTGDLVVRGPAPAPIERIKGRHRVQIQLRSSDGSSARHAARQVRSAFREHAKRSGIRLLIDVDPVEML